MSGSANIGVIGLGVMGRNLALNFADRGMWVAGMDRNPAAVQDFASGDDRLVAAASAKELAVSLVRPRTALLMVPSGAPVDAVVDDLVEHFETGDIIIDGGNSRWTDTAARIERCAAAGVRFVGMGISGGARGAREGPSMMPGGDRDAWEHIKGPLQGAAAQAHGEPCCDWIGPGGSGHFVKMVHNGIEYGLMQLICEVYQVLRMAAGVDARGAADMFERWNSGDLDSFLVEITGKVLGIDDEDGTPRVERIVDHGEQKGTGRWTAQDALELGVAAPTITAAVEARNLSGARDLRERITGAVGAGPGASERIAPDTLERALGAAFRLCYTQGMEILRAASEAHAWALDLHSILGLWRGGCIIRARMLDELRGAVADGPRHALLHGPIADRMKNDRVALTETLRVAHAHRIPTPGLSASLAYLDQLAAVALPHNLLQAQRDAFGSHGYRRTDRGGVFTADWLGDGAERSK